MGFEIELPVTSVSSFPKPEYLKDKRAEFLEGRLSLENLLEPAISGEIKRIKPITLGMWKYAQGLTKKPVKGILTGQFSDSG